MLRPLLRPGDTVLVDDPCYFNFQALLRAHQVRIVGIPSHRPGRTPGLEQALLVVEKPRLYITNSALPIRTRREPFSSGGPSRAERGDNTRPDHRGGRHLRRF